MAHASPDEAYHSRFAGIARLYGDRALARLAEAHVTIIGLGGVGSWTVEALARSGIGRLTLVDLDEVCVTNTNRQLHAVAGTVGRSKADVLSERVASINPSCAVTVVEDFLTAATVNTILAQRVDVVVDAIDQFENKCLLLDRCRELEQPCVVVGGAGGRVDPSRVALGDMATASGDRLLAMIRKRLRQKHGFPRKGRWGVSCVYRDEPRRYPDGAGDVCTTRPEGDGPKRLDCAEGFGAAVFVTGTFGFFAAKAAVESILERPAETA